MNYFEIGLVLGIIVLILLPPKYDPAIRMKEYLDERKKS